MNNIFTTAILSAEGKSLIEELWDYFAENYLDSNTVYTNLGIDSSSPITIPMILFGIFIGIIASVIAMVYDKRVLGKFVRNMLSEGAVGRENAKTLYHFGTNERSSVGRSLRRGINLRRVVRCVEEEDYYKELKEAREKYEKKREEDPSLPPFKEAEFVFTEGEHFYIPEDKKYTAEIRFAKGGASWWSIPLTIVGALVGFFILLALLPYILTLLDQAIGSFKTM